MTWMQAVDAVADRLATDGMRVPQLEKLARMIEIRSTDQNRAAVGAAIERTLRDRYRTLWANETDARVFQLGQPFPGEEYRDRVDRAKSDAMHAILGGRHEGDPFDSFPYADDIAAAPAGAYREHLRSFYGITEGATN